MLNSGLLPPLFEEETNWFKVTLFHASLKEGGGDPIDTILGLFERKTEITSSEVRGALSVSKATAVAHITRLIDQGRVLKVGNGPNTRYKISGT